MENFKNKIKTIFKVTNGELYVSVLFLIALVIGSIASNYQNNSTKDLIINSSFFTFLDSIESKHSVQLNDTLRELSNNEVSNDEQISNFNNNNYSSFASNSKKLKSGENVSININTASKTDLMRLPGVGDKTADAIIAYRNSNKFKKINDIMNVKGIGPAKFPKIKDFINIK